MVAFFLRKFATKKSRFGFDFFSTFGKFISVGVIFVYIAQTEHWQHQLQEKQQQQQ